MTVTVLVVLLAVNGFIVLSGRTYLYKGIANTYLKGRTGPSIYDLDVFHSRQIKHKAPVDLFIETSGGVDITLSKLQRDYVEELDTKALLVVKNDTLLYEEYWGEHSQQALSNSFSIAKTAVGMLIAIAIEEGYIESMDDPVHKYVPSYDDHARRIITIRHLIEMASGLSWTESTGNPFSDNAESYYGTNLKEHIGRQKRISEPGMVFNYQSGNSQLLGMIIEASTGQTVSAYLEAKIWSKIGMESDAFWSLDRKYGTEKAFCCLYATARDFARLGKLILNKGVFKGEQIFPLWYYDEIVRINDLVTEDGYPNRCYSMHIWTYRGGDSPVYYCRGINGQYLICIPDEDLLIVRLGMKRKPEFEIPENRKNDSVYIAQNKDKIGHCLGIFEYIALGKDIVAQKQDNERRTERA